jgi:biotin carboxyl carrier protein
LIFPVVYGINSRFVKIYEGGYKNKKMQEIIEAPIPGKVLSVDVAVGNTVEEGAVVCTIEAMKMENPILSPVKGSVTEVEVSSGATVKTGEKLVVIEY